MADNESTQAHKPTQPAVAGDPGYGLGIAGFIVSFFVGVAGLVMSAIALNQSKHAGRKNTLAFAGLVIGIIRTSLDVLAIVGAIIGIVFLAHYCTQNADDCRDNSNGGQYDYPQDSQTSPDMNKTY